MAQNIDKRFYKAVSSNDVEEDSYVVPNGKVLEIEHIGGDAAVSSEVKVEIKFGDDILLATHNSANQDMVRIACSGDGTKAVKIRLVNDSAISETIGGFYHGVLI